MYKRAKSNRSCKSTHHQDSSSSRVARFWRKIHHRSHRHASSSQKKHLAAEDFADIALLTLHGEKKFLLERNGPHIARISVFEVCNELNSSVQNVQFFLFYAFSLNKMRKFLDEEV
ncbi:phosphatidylserine decarboxylase proenzyme 2-like [Vitis riparia]|uniref:phosphatidylserine decarboxylase proenzyme 2-like n=1 Tax=Vitis riparia TaxID=96939 RepID=UPI00155A20A8|nr:phosphatidylserine decarboxylase proenzyme 2-like [Vitis riparia]